MSATGSGRLMTVYRLTRLDEVEIQPDQVQGMETDSPILGICSWIRIATRLA
jgi:hypothetical protein